MSERPKAMGKRKRLYPDADPTAPGGMSQEELRSELTTYHGYMDIEVEEMSWPDLIDATCQGRLAREKEQREMEKNPPIFVGMPGTYDYVFDGHMGASPSGAERWMRCTASLRASRAFLETLSPNQQKAFASGSEAARQGTTAHAAGETELRYLLGQITEEERDASLMELTLMPETEGEAYDDEMAEHVSHYTQLVETFMAERGPENVLIEAKVNAAIPLPENSGIEDDVHIISGSGDCVVLPTEEHPSLVVIDYKHGEGKDVDVDENPQVRIYGLGALDLIVDDEGVLTRPVDEVVYYIVQPRSGGIKEFRESLDDLLDWRDEELSPSTYAALTGDGAKFDPADETCQWCPAKSGCAALIEQRVADGAELFDAVQEDQYENGPDSTIDASLLSDERLATLYLQMKPLDKLLKILKDEAERRLHRGQHLPGLRLVNYQPQRFWKEEAAEQLEDEAALWKKALLTPTQALAMAEKTLKDEGLVATLNDLIEKPDMRPVIGTEENDNRKTWAGVPPEQMFDVLEEEA